ncbi:MULTISPECIES: threonine synthase [Caldilinea]|uniref:threonine synthase n=1 Tax=Caldilinea TaxID=233191 RepID=UPI0002D654CD|nr:MULTISPECIES: threonine synthase [Caldilinea]MBO9393421.1 threonine synthase [Caldilinea sp.]
MNRKSARVQAIESPFVKALRCLRCGKEYAPGAIEYVCPCRSNRGSDLGTLDVVYDYTAVAQAINPETMRLDADTSIGRFWPLLPIADRKRLPPLPVGGTPLLSAPRLRQETGFSNLWIKDDGRNPSASFKDRASAIAVARAQMESRPIVATASTGNAAAALAALAAAAGQRTVIFVPKSAPPAKVAQLLVYGSIVLAVNGSYDDAFDLCTEACLAFGWYNRSTGYNPYMTEGKKTVSYEIALQLAERTETKAPMKAPDAVFVSVGDGCIIGGVHKGFKDLLTLGWIERMPRIYGVQSTRSPALYNAWRSGAEIPEPVHATTRADSISVDAPRDPIKALNAVRQTGGAFVLVEDEAILQAILPLARLGAVFAEPAGAAAYAGLLQACHNGLVHEDETIVVINTGSGLKDVRAAMEVAGAAYEIEPSLIAVQKVLKEGALSA